ncbi:putative E3 ubiquitin ligase [Handroanthus impetiginosus]|uniref:RING-type E3 ubiquitin transferase n=1 Tax=Handroanthus impetiginosus TaxID=429701 RepID=A0A2G9GKZ4_9LAMI|nr:putative E3 ubiquitin ligase [Handroanthus impetiginosus]
MNNAFWSPYNSFQFSANWNYNSFQNPPFVFYNAGYVFVNVNNPYQIPVGYYPIPSYHHNHVHHPHDPFQAAETNDQLLNNPDQSDLDSIRAQEEYEFEDEDYEYEDDESYEYDDDNNEYPREYLTTTLGEEDQLLASDFLRQYRYWRNLLSTYGTLQQNIMNFRDAHRSEFYSTNFLDGHWPGFYSTRHDGLSEDTITGRLKTRSINTATDEDHEILCVVCQDCLFQGEDKIATLECGHEYHEGCIKNWLMRKNSCPLCNAIGIRLNSEGNIHVQL